MLNRPSVPSSLRRRPGRGARPAARLRASRAWPALALVATTFACRSDRAPAAESRPEPAVAVAPPPAAPEPVPTRTSHARAEGQLGPGRGVVLIHLEPPEGAKLNREAPLSARAGGGIGLSFPERLKGPLGEHEMPLRIPIDVQDGATGPAEVDLSYYWCEDGKEAACQREKIRLRLDLDLTGDGAGGEAYLAYRTSTS